MDANFGPHRWSAGWHDDGANAEHQGARFVVRDLRGARFVDCDLSGVRIRDGFLHDVEVSGFVQGLVVNGVDVTAHVEAELDRRHPERVALREARTADDLRAVWRDVQGRWAEALARTEALPAAALDERVDEEWSFHETLRHLVWITDSWASRTMLDDETPFHPLALPQTAYSPADAADLGVELDARPTREEVLAARADRVDVVRRLLEPLTDSGLDRICERSPAPGYPEEPRTVAECLGVVLEEECEHLRFALRDLDRLEV